MHKGLLFRRAKIWRYGPDRVGCLNAFRSYPSFSDYKGSRDDDYYSMYGLFTEHTPICPGTVRIEVFDGEISVIVDDGTGRLVAGGAYSVYDKNGRFHHFDEARARVRQSDAGTVDYRDGCILLYMDVSDFDVHLDYSVDPTATPGSAADTQATEKMLETLAILSS